MADVTISQLTQGVPSGNNILPYSTGSNTLGVPVSAIFQNSSAVGINGPGVVQTSEGSGPIALSLYNSNTSNPVNGIGSMLHLRNTNSTDQSKNTILFAASDTGGSFRHGAAIVSGKESNWIGDSGNYPGYLSFWTRDSNSGSQSEKMRISSSGAVTKPYQPFLYVSRRNAGSYDYTAGNNSDNITPVIYSLIEQQRGEGSYNSSTGKYTIPATGLYMIEAGVNTTNGPVTQLWAVRNTIRLQTFGASSYSSNITFGTTIVYLNKDDTFNVSLFTPGINSINIAENYYHTFMRIAFLG